MVAKGAHKVPAIENTEELNKIKKPYYLRMLFPPGFWYNKTYLNIGISTIHMLYPICILLFFFPISCRGAMDSAGGE